MRKTLVEQRNNLKSKNKKTKDQINALNEKNKILEKIFDHAIEFYNSYVDQLITMKSHGDDLQLDIIMNKYNEYSGFDIKKL